MVFAFLGSRKTLSATKSKEREGDHPVLDINGGQELSSNAYDTIE